jgi:hypothetical protein
MSEHARDWDDSVINVAEEMVQQRGAEGAISELQRRRKGSDDEKQQRCNEAIAWIRREVSDDE